MFQVLANKAETLEPGAPEPGALVSENNCCELVAYYMQLLHNDSQGSARAIKKKAAAPDSTTEQETSK